MTRSIVDPRSFFFELGGIHDAKIQKVAWDVLARTITLAVDDLNANFNGLSEYVGKREVSIVFSEIEDFQLNCDAIKSDIQRVYDLEIKTECDSGENELLMRISPSGRLRCNFKFVEIVDVHCESKQLSGIDHD